MSATLAGTAVAQPADPGAPPPAGDLAAPPAAPPVITTPTNAPAATPEQPASTTVATSVPPPPPPATTIAPVKIDSPSTTIKFGFLGQFQWEATQPVAPAGTATPLDGYSQNLFVRRTRILVGGTLFGKIDYFFDTDFANLFKASPVAGAAGAPATMAKATPGMNIQDAFVTYKPFGDLLKVDAGYMLPPLAHNALQGAGSLYSWDYFSNSFLHSSAPPTGFLFGASTNSVGRDVGLQLRGLVLDGHLEYRVGMFQGVRNTPSATEVGSRNMFRTTARVQINLLDAEPGFFYAGTYFGAKKILSVGGSFDMQENYKYWAADALADLPLGPGVVTAQVNVAQWNAGDKTELLGGAAGPIIPKQTAVMGEAGYTISAMHASPILRIEHRIATGTAKDETRIGGGLAFWPYLHNTNLKVFYTRVMQEDSVRNANQFNVQWQVYFF
ncbi:MAG: porin [Myxococcales bacterium]